MDYRGISHKRACVVMRKRDLYHGATLKQRLSLDVIEYLD